MKHGRFYVCAVACLPLALSLMTLLISIQPGLAYNPNDPIRDEVVYRPNDDALLTMSYPQARRIIEAMENRRLPIPPGYTSYTYNDTLYNNIRISADKVTWNENYPKLFWACTIDFASMNPNVVKSHAYGTFNVLLCEAAPWYHGSIKQVCTGCSRAGSTSATDTFWSSLEKDEAVSLADAFYVLKRYAEGYVPAPENDAAAEGAFADGARRYREMPVKPVLPEDVQRCRVVAEDAFKNKDFQKALNYYRKGLAIEPFWPQGQFNAAVLEGELHWYRWAVLHMKHYLELVPEAKNAEAARERIYLWEEKAKDAMQKLTGAGR